MQRTTGMRILVIRLLIQRVLDIQTPTFSARKPGCCSNREYELSWRQNGRFAVISTARLGATRADASADALTLQRFRKLLTKNIAVLYYHLPFSDNPLSVLYPNPTRLDDLDKLGEDILISKT